MLKNYLDQAPPDQVDVSSDDVRGAVARWGQYHNIDSPHEGLCTPEDLLQDYVIYRKALLSKFVSIPSDWTQLINRQVYFKENRAKHPDEDMWQLKNFVFVH